MLPALCTKMSTEIGQAKLHQDRTRNTMGVLCVCQLIELARLFDRCRVDQRKVATNNDYLVVVFSNGRI